MGKLTIIEHPKLVCPHCGASNSGIMSTRQSKTKEQKLIVIDRYCHCRDCKKNFKTVEYPRGGEKKFFRL